MYGRLRQVVLFLGNQIFINFNSGGKEHEKICMFVDA